MNNDGRAAQDGGRARGRVNDSLDVNGGRHRFDTRRREQQLLDDDERRRQHIGVRSRKDRLQRQHDAVIIVVGVSIEVGVVVAMRELVLRRFVRVVREAAVVVRHAMAVNDERWQSVPSRFGVHVLDRRQRQRRQAHREEQRNQKAGTHRELIVCDRRLPGN